VVPGSFEAERAKTGEAGQMARDPPVHGPALGIAGEKAFRIPSVALGEFPQGNPRPPFTGIYQRSSIPFPSQNDDPFNLPCFLSHC
jgi:hypothetical protein